MWTSFTFRLWDKRCPWVPFERNLIPPSPPSEASFQSAAGLIKSAWRYEGDKCLWDFTIPEGATATVTLPGSSESMEYTAGSYHLEL